MPTLRAVSGPYAGQQFSIGDGVEMGRDPSCAICLANDTGVSRQHARFELQAGRVIAHDLGSRNGLVVNGARTASTIIQVGDQVQLGNTILVLEGDPVPAPAYSTPVAEAPPMGSGYIPAGAAPASIPGMPAYTPPPSAPAPPPMPNPLVPGMVPPGYPGYASPAPAVPYARLLYLLGFSIPPIGIILGLVYMLRETQEEQLVGKWLLFWSILGGILLWLSLVSLAKLLPFALSLIGKSGGGEMSDLLKQ